MVSFSPPAGCFGAAESVVELLVFRHQFDPLRAVEVTDSTFFVRAGSYRSKYFGRERCESLPKFAESEIFCAGGGLMEASEADRVRFREWAGERTQSDVAAEIGVSKPMLSMWLSGKRELSSRLIRRFSDATGVPLEVFAVAKVHRES